MIKLAWRNIWRNKRRTLITAASIFFAVFFAIIMRAFHMGSWRYLLDSVVQSYTGYIQIHAGGYWDNKTIDNTFTYDPGLDAKIHSTLKKHSSAIGLVPRLESFALASSGLKTKGVLVVGINPMKEDLYTKLSKKLVQGSYLHYGDSGVLVAQRLARHLELSVNDTLVLISQGYHGTSAAGKYRIQGIIHLPAPEFDNQVIYMNLPVCQSFYSAPGQLSSLMVSLTQPRDIDNTDKIAHSIQKSISRQYEVMTWKEMLTELVQEFKSDNASGIIILLILYIIVGFGIFGTVLMMTSERTHEFGVMTAVGMQKYSLALQLTIELFFIGILGIVSGMIGSIPIVTYFHYHPIKLSGSLAKMMVQYGMDPILPVSWHSDYFFHQGLAIFIIMIIAIAYPLISVLRLNIIKALRKP